MYLNVFLLYARGGGEALSAFSSARSHRASIFQQTFDSMHDNLLLPLASYKLPIA
jgi:hypothetical protein